MSIGFAHLHNLYIYISILCASYLVLLYLISRYMISTKVSNLWKTKTLSGVYSSINWPSFTKLKINKNCLDYLERVLFIYILFCTFRSHQWHKRSVQKEMRPKKKKRLGHWMMEGRTPSFESQCANAHWGMAYSHKTQSFMKNRGQQKCLDKALTVVSTSINIWFQQVLHSVYYR